MKSAVLICILSVLAMCTMAVLSLSFEGGLQLITFPPHSNSGFSKLCVTTKLCTAHNSCNETVKIILDTGSAGFMAFYKHWLLDKHNETIRHNVGWGIESLELSEDPKHANWDQPYANLVRWSPVQQGALFYYSKLSGGVAVLSGGTSSVEWVDENSFHIAFSSEFRVSLFVRYSEEFANYFTSTYSSDRTKYAILGLAPSASFIPPMDANKFDHSYWPSDLNKNLDWYPDNRASMSFTFDFRRELSGGEQLPGRFYLNRFPTCVTTSTSAHVISARTFPGRSNTWGFYGAISLKQSSQGWTFAQRGGRTTTTILSIAVDTGVNVALLLTPEIHDTLNNTFVNGHPTIRVHYKNPFNDEFQNFQASSLGLVRRFSDVGLDHTFDALLGSAFLMNTRLSWTFANDGLQVERHGRTTNIRTPNAQFHDCVSVGSNFIVVDSFPPNMS